MKKEQPFSGPDKGFIARSFPFWNKICSYRLGLLGEDRGCAPSPHIRKGTMKLKGLAKSIDIFVTWTKVIREELKCWGYKKEANLLTIGKKRFPKNWGERGVSITSIVLLRSGIFPAKSLFFHSKDLTNSLLNSSGDTQLMRWEKLMSTRDHFLLAGALYNILKYSNSPYSPRSVEVRWHIATESHFWD